MARKKKTAKEISDEVAADALRGGGQSGPMPTHPAMATTDPDADATDAAQDDGDFDEDRTQ
jgi:hypothetical protein